MAFPKLSVARIVQISLIVAALVAIIALSVELSKCEKKRKNATTTVAAVIAAPVTQAASMFSASPQVKVYSGQGRENEDFATSRVNSKLGTYGEQFSTSRVKFPSSDKKMGLYGESFPVSRATKSQENLVTAKGPLGLFAAGTEPLSDDDSKSTFKAALPFEGEGESLASVYGNHYSNNRQGSNDDLIRTNIRSSLKKH